MPPLSRSQWLSVATLSLLLPSVLLAQPSGDMLRGAGSYLEGLGWYNLNTARAGSINVDATIRWKADLRKIQQERRMLDLQAKGDKKLRVEEARQKLYEREQQLRANPSASDVHSGDALDVLLYDLTDPDISFGVWQSNQISLPSGMSVKDVIFQFTPLGASSSSSVALGRGVIALSRLDINSKWPTPLKMDELATARAAYERSYAKVREEVLAGELGIKSLLAMDAVLDAFKAKVKEVVPSERGYRTEALRFLTDLTDATRMFDASTVDYAREILLDTRDHDAKTVGELVAFMSKYRLQFSSAERHPAARALYTQLYQAFREQAKALGISSAEATSAESKKLADRDAAKLLTKGSRWLPEEDQFVWTVESNDGKTATLTRAATSSPGTWGVTVAIDGQKLTPIEVFHRTKIPIANRNPRGGGEINGDKMKLDFSVESQTAGGRWRPRWHVSHSFTRLKD